MRAERGGRGSKTEKATQNIHWRKMCPRPPVWSELGTGQAAGQWWLSMFTPGMCFKHQSNNHNYNTNSITTIKPNKHYLRPSAPGPGSPGMMVTSLVRPDSVSLFVQRWETNVWLWVTSCDIRARVTRGRGSWGHQRIVWDDLSSCVTMTPGCW